MATDTKVLVVDGDCSAAGGLALMLNQHEFLVNVAHDGQSAIHIATEWLPDIVLLDWPGMNGCEPARQIRARLPGCRILMFSDPDLAEEPATEHGTATADFELLPRTLDPDELVNKLRSAP